MTFLDRVVDAELRHEIRVVLARLELLSESDAAPAERSSRSSETALGPPGFAGLSPDKCPPADRSLFDHYRWRFQRAIETGTPTKQLYFLLWEAEKACDTRVVPPGPDNPRRALILTRADEDALKKAIIADYEGVHSYRVHLDLNLPQGWIEKVREDAGHEPETGYRRPRWLALDDDRKRSLVRQLRAAGKTQAETAKWLGVSRRTVVNYDRNAA